MAEQSVANNPHPQLRPSRLGTLAGVRRELARLYCDARTGLINPTAAAKLAYILTCLQKAIETGDLEARLAAIEALQVEVANA